MQCTNCGARNADGAAYCANCGNSLEARSGEAVPDAPNAGATQRISRSDLDAMRDREAVSDASSVRSVDATPVRDNQASTPDYAAPGQYAQPSAVPQSAFTAPVQSETGAETPVSAAESPRVESVPSTGTSPSRAAASRQPGTMGGITASMPSDAQLDRLRAIGSKLDPVAAPLEQPLAPLEAIGPQILAWIGAGLLAIGFLFLPVFTVSVFGFSANVKMWDYSKFQWLIDLLVVIATVALAYFRVYRLLIITGVIGLLIALLGFIDHFGEQFVSHSYGWLFIFLGAIAIVLAGIVRDTAKRRSLTGA